MECDRHNNNIFDPRVTFFHKSQDGKHNEQLVLPIHKLNAKGRNGISMFQKTYIDRFTTSFIPMLQKGVEVRPVLKVGWKTPFLTIFGLF